MSSGGLVFLRRQAGGPSELWRTDGTLQGTTLVGTIASGSIKYPGFTDMGGTAFFFTGGYTSADELWKTDGTVAGTVLVKVVNASGNAYPRNG